MKLFAESSQHSSSLCFAKTPSRACSGEAERRRVLTLFFSLLRQNTIEGMFCDPIHGGNVDMVGWQLVGFPGPRMNNYDDVDKHFGEAFRPKPVSLSGGHPSEDETS